jgi:hypothetical protein
MWPKQAVSKNLETEKEENASTERSWYSFIQKAIKVIRRNRERRHHERQETYQDADSSR